MSFPGPGHLWSKLRNVEPGQVWRTTFTDHSRYTVVLTLSQTLRYSYMCAWHCLVLDHNGALYRPGHPMTFDLSSGWERVS